MSRQEYQRQLEQLRTDVIDMSELVIERFDLSISAYESGDIAQAERVIEGDHEINELYLTLEDECIGLLALQQPVAGDLRFIAASFKIITDLERIADLATNLARYGTYDVEPVLPFDAVKGLSLTARSMVIDAMDAYETEDGGATRQIAAIDDDLDEACQTISEEVIRELLQNDPGEYDQQTTEAKLADVKRSLLTIRDIERIGDHAVNIAARTLYMIENDDELIY